jgi:hypothetical protein
VSAHRGTLTILPPVDLASHARAALQGAQYHLQQLGLLIDEGLPVTASKRFHFHLRAFFWELVATFDSMLQWVNQARRLGLKERDVCWQSVREAADQADLQSSELEALRVAFDSEWFFEARQYRNFSHRAFQFVQVEREPDGSLTLIWLLPSRDGQPPCYSLRDQLAEYALRMEKLVMTVLPGAAS